MSTDLHDLLVPYALDALDAHERSRFESHLDHCDVCSAELSGFRATSIRLAESAAETPPESLRGTLLERVATTAQERPVVTALAQRSALRRSAPRLAVAAAALVAVAGVGGFLVEHQKADELRTESDRISAVMTADDSAIVSAPVRTGGELRVMHSASHGDAVVVGSELTRLGEDEVYQVWSMHDGTPRSEGLLGRGSGVLLAPDTADADAFAVTVEPKGGSEQPTTEPIVAAQA